MTAMTKLNASGQMAFYEGQISNFKGGGHVGIVSGIDRYGNPILISGNNGRYGVAETVYPRARILAYVLPKR